MTRYGGDVGAGGGFFRFDLVAHGGDCLGVRPNKHNARLGERLGKRRALGQKTVARMYRFGAAFLAGSNDPVDQKVALRGRRRPDRDCRVGHLDMERVAVSLGINRNGCDPHAAGGLDDPTGDFAAVGNEDSLEHFRVETREPARWLCGVVARMSMTAAC